MVPAIGPGSRAFLAASARPRPCGWMAQRDEEEDVDG